MGEGWREREGEEGMVFKVTILHYKAVLGLQQPWLINEMNFCMKHAPGAGSITQLLNLQSNDP